jgi:sorbitol-specific phosphotransferase system component IIBC
MKAKKRTRNFSRPALMGSFQQPIPLRAAAINAPTATYTAIDTPSDVVKDVQKAGQEQIAQENAKAQQDAIINEQKHAEYLEQQQSKENAKQKRENIIKGVGSTVGTVIGAEFGAPGMALGNFLGGLAGEGINSLINLF